MWSRSHPVEQYRLLKDQFAFDEEARGANGSVKMSLRFVWGVLALQQAALLDPGNTGPVVMDDTFNVSDSLSQMWMLNFCVVLKKQDFFNNATTAGKLYLMLLRLIDCLID